MLAKAHSACNVNTHKKNLKSCSLDVISRQDGSMSNNNNDFVRVSQHKSNENLSNLPKGSMRTCRGTEKATRGG